MAMAWSPGLNFVTPAPTADTTPAGSLPGMNGSVGLNWYLPLIITRSTKFTAVARTSSSTSPGLASGLGMSPSDAFSIGPNSRTTTARMIYGFLWLVVRRAGCLLSLPRLRGRVGGGG